MRRIIPAYKAMVYLIAAIMGLWVLAPVEAEAQQRKSIRWATSGVGTFGYTFAAQMVNVMQEALGAEYIVTVHPYPSNTAAMKAAMDGGADISYTADIGMTQAVEGIGGFKNYKPAKGPLTHTWYAYPLHSFLVIHSQQAGKVASWNDLSGKPSFYTPAGFMNWLNFQRMFKILGYEFKHVEIGAAAQSDALQDGTIVGAGAYATSGVSLPTYWRETELRTDIKVLNPSAAEVEKLKAGGLNPVEISAANVFRKDVGPQQIIAVPILNGYNARADVPEDIIYRMLTTFYEKREKLAALDAGFAPLAKDFLTMQVNGINANPSIAVHPGLAKFLREHNAWQDKWTIAKQ